METIQRGHVRRSQLIFAAAVVVFVTVALASAHTRAESLLGGVLMALALTDVFLTILYARMGTSIIGNQLGRMTWAFFRVVSRPFGRSRDLVLSFAGPAVLIVLLFSWTAMLTIGAAMVIHPFLGTTVRASSGDTATNFATALWVAGGSLSSATAGEVSPTSGALRVFFVFVALVAMSALSLTLTYLMQVYTALHARNTLGAKVHSLTGETGDAAELLAALGARGRFEAEHSQLAELAGEIASVKESHHLYPVLFYFRFREAHYSVSRISLVTLDAASLAKSALAPEKYEWLQESAALDHLFRATVHLVTALESTFLGQTADVQEPDAETVERWTARYAAAVERLRQAGVETRDDDDEGARLYVSLRTRWDGQIAALAPSGAYHMAEIDVAGSNPEVAGTHEPFEARRKTFPRTAVT